MPGVLVFSVRDDQKKVSNLFINIVLNIKSDHKLCNSMFMPVPAEILLSDVA